jgi:hypothetical protein
LTWLVIFIIFLQKEKKKQNKRNNKILPVTSTCRGAVVRNECMNHFSYSYTYAQWVCLAKNMKENDSALPLFSSFFFFFFIFNDSAAPNLSAAGQFIEGIIVELILQGFKYASMVHLGRS